MKPSKALVTGGAGFIGSHLVDALLEKDLQVTVIDDLSTGKIENISHLQGKIRFIQGDIRDRIRLREAITGCDVVFHEAAVVSVPKTVEMPIETSLVNDFGTLVVLEEARKAGVRKMVFASSCAVYGDDPKLPKDENLNPSPKSPYAVQKLIGEQYAALYSNLYGLPTVSLRYFNVYGPRQDPSSPYSGVISIFLSKAASRSTPVIYGDGEQSRDFIFVKDVVRANLMVAESDAGSGLIFNIGTGKALKINELWKSICSLAGYRSEPKYEDARSGDIMKSVADITRIKGVFGFTPLYPFVDGLKETYDSYLE
ncbi:MAG: SDR family oxidoreductase [Thermodesulfobacteriota bacterium]